jgi:hypothetical protein
VQQAAGVVVIERLPEQVAVEVDGGVGRDDQLGGRGHGGSLLSGEPFDVDGAGLAGTHGLVEVGRPQLEGEAQARQQLEAARRARGQDQTFGHRFGRSHRLSRR